MSLFRRLAGVIIVVIITLVIVPAQAQQVQVTTPLVNANQSFYEQIGVSWGIKRGGPNGGFSFNFGSPGATAPAFGGFNPNSQANFGFGVRSKGGSGFFNLTAGQGSNRSIISSAPTLMLQNGIPGMVQDVSVRPFVTSFTPVVGGRTTVPLTFTSPLEERLGRLRQQAASENPRANPSDRELLLGAAARHATEPQPQAAQPTRTVKQSSASRGDISLAEIRRRQNAAELQSDASTEIQHLVENARVAEARGLPGAARIRYRKAARLATGHLKEELLAKLETLAPK